MPGTTDMGWRKDEAKPGRPEPLGRRGVIEEKDNRTESTV